jgi:hypothetical protein
MLGLVSVDFGFISTSFLIFSDEIPNRTVARQGCHVVETAISDNVCGFRDGVSACL